LTKSLNNKNNESDSKIEIESKKDIKTKVVKAKSEDTISELVLVKIDENISEVKTKDLKKLKTIEMERLLFGTATLGFYDNGNIFEDIHFQNSSGQKGEYKSILNESQKFKGVYKIATSKICYLLDGTDDWQCAVLYKHKKLSGIYYWAVKGKIFAKIVKVMDIPAYEKMKFDHSEVEKARREEKKRIAEEKRVAEEKRIVEEKRLAEEKRVAEEKRIIENKYNKFKAKNSYQKDIIKTLHSFELNYEDIKFLKNDKVIEISNLDYDEFKIDIIEITGLNQKYLSKFFEIVNNNEISSYDEMIRFKYDGKFFDEIKISGINFTDSINDSFLKINEFGFNNLDFKKYDMIKDLFKADFIDDLENNLLSFVLSMQFDNIYFKNIEGQDNDESFLIEYFEISDWNEFSFEDILVKNFIYKKGTSQISFEDLVIENYYLDTTATYSLLQTNYSQELLRGNYSQVLNSFKSLDNFQIKNFKSLQNNSKLYSFDSAQLKDLNFDYFGTSADIKVPTSLSIEIIGSDYDTLNFNQEFGSIQSILGYDSIKFDLGTSWKWNTNKNNIAVNLDFGLTDAASLNLSTSIADLNTNILTLQGMPLMTYLMTTPKLRDFNLSLVDNSLKDKLITYGSQMQNMTTSQFRDFLTQSLNLATATIGIDQNLANEFVVSVINFINDSNKISISINPIEPVSVNDLIPDIMIQDYSSLFGKLNIKIAN
jgi:hypothetical protein